MSKKFDVVIGNPPYQEEASGDATHAKPVYHLFMNAAYEVGKKAVLITPARFLCNAGYTPKAWNKKMLTDEHLGVPYYVDKSNELFPGTDIKGGIAITYRDEDLVREPIGTFTRHSNLKAIVNKVDASQSGSIASVITSSRSYRYTDKMHADHPGLADTMSAGEQKKVNTRTFEQLSILYHEDRPADGHDYVQVLGLINNMRMTRWIRSDYIAGPESFGAYKVAVPKANGSGSFGEVLSSPQVLGPNMAVTQTFITIGTFDDQFEADACLKYVKTKFARTLLGVLKITQDNPAKVWKYVPLQDFTSETDIDWAKPIPQIDEQLYAKYGLEDDEIAFIEAQVKPME
jgi:hypothetical protein